MKSERQNNLQSKDFLKKFKDLQKYMQAIKQHQEFYKIFKIGQSKKQQNQQSRMTHSSRVVPYSKQGENIYTPFHIYPLVRVLRSLKPLCRLVPTARPLDILFRRCFRKTTQKNNSQGQSGEAMRSTLDCYFFAWQETSTDGHIVPEGLNRPRGRWRKPVGVIHLQRAIKGIEGGVTPSQVLKW